MKLTINKNQLNMQPEQWLRQAGYAYYRDRRTGKDSFSRRLGSGFFPKLHMYVIEQDGKIVFDLHLDQKQASYAGAHMHNAEHDGEVVVAEIARLKDLLNINQDSHVDARLPTPEGVANGGQVHVDKNPLDKIGSGEYDKEAKPKPKKSWWRF